MFITTVFFLFSIFQIIPFTIIFRFMYLKIKFFSELKSSDFVLRNCCVFFHVRCEMNVIYCNGFRVLHSFNFFRHLYVWLSLRRSGSAYE